MARRAAKTERAAEEIALLEVLAKTLNEAVGDSIILCALTRPETLTIHTKGGYSTIHTKGGYSTIHTKGGYRKKPFIGYEVFQIWRFYVGKSRVIAVFKPVDPSFEEIEQIEIPLTQAYEMLDDRFKVFMDTTLGGSFHEFLTRAKNEIDRMAEEKATRTDAERYADVAEFGSW